MSEITKKDIEHVAALARIRLGDKEQEKMSKELKAILGYIDKLKEADTEGVEPIANIVGLENVLRKDEPNKKPLAEQAVDSVKLVEMAPDNKDNLIKVPAVFGE